MLIEFKVTNYRSIREEQTLSLIASNADDELPQNTIETPLPGMKGAKLLKAAAIYGANASGKSNLLEALRFVVGFVRDSATGLKPDAPTGTQYFKLDPACAGQPSKFELHAVINGTRMLYGLEVTRQRVTSEYLVAYPKGKPQVWFERDWNEEGKKYKWSKSSAQFSHDEALRSRTRENASFVALAAQFDQPQARVVWDWIGSAFYFADERQDLSPLNLAAALLEKESVRAILVQVLASVDLGIVDARVIKKGNDMKTFLRAVNLRLKDIPEEKWSGLPDQPGIETEYSLSSDFNFKPSEFSEPELLHRGKDGSAIPMDFYSEESTGTRRFLSLIIEAFLGAGRGHLTVVDELESSLHPLLVREIISVITGFPATDGRCPQLIFTTHNPLLLDQTLLRRDQIWFTEKDQEGATRLYPLTDFKPRKDEALVKGYLSGRYGGIPFIPERLTVTP